jgi:elongation factor G
VADHDEQLADAWLEGRVIDAEQLRAAIRRATLAGAGVPVLAGAAFKDKGIETLLDAVVDYLPSPLDRPAVSAEMRARWCCRRTRTVRWPACCSRSPTSSTAR